MKDHPIQELNLGVRNNADVVAKNASLRVSFESGILPMQMKKTPLQNNQELVQRMINQSSHMQELKSKQNVILQRKNKTGLPNNLKSGMENLSGISLDDVKVHYNSARPAQLQAHAYAQGNQIHIGPGQEKHLAHEAWHVVQQKQGRVKPTVQMQGVNINDNIGLEKEADSMGQKALQNAKSIQKKKDNSSVQ